MKPLDRSRVEVLIQRLREVDQMVAEADLGRLPGAITQLVLVTYDLDTLARQGGDSPEQLPVALETSDRLYGHLVKQARAPNLAPDLAEYLYQGARRLGEVNGRLRLADARV